MHYRLRRSAVDGLAELRKALVLILVPSFLLADHVAASRPGIEPAWVTALGYKNGSGGNDSIYRLLTEPNSDAAEFRKQSMAAREALDVGGVDKVAFDVWAWGHISVAGRFPAVDDPTPRGTLASRKRVVDRIADLSLSPEAKPEEQLRLVKLAWLLRLIDTENTLVTPFDNLEALRSPNSPYTYALPPELLKELEKLEELRSHQGGSTEHMSRAALALQALIERRLVDNKSDEINATIISSTEAFLASDPDLWSAHSVLAMLWQTRCLADSRKDNAASQQIMEAVDRMLPRAKHPLVRKWLEETKTLAGPAPLKPVVRVIEHPNELKPARGP